MTQTVAIMQPYFLPYLGYWQLMAHVDQMVIYDQIKYTKRGWINRNRFLKDGQPHLMSLPLKSGSDSLSIHEREIASSFDAQALLRQLDQAYKKAPYFDSIRPLVQDILQCSRVSLFEFILESIVTLKDYLDINTRLTISSEIESHPELKNQDRVIGICHDLAADVYVNPIGGTSLYQASDFSPHGIALQFLQSKLTPYPQFHHEFIPALSIIDVLFFNGKDQTKQLIAHDYNILGMNNHSFSIEASE